MASQTIENGQNLPFIMLDCEFIRFFETKILKSSKTVDG